VVSPWPRGARFDPPWIASKAREAARTRLCFWAHVEAEPMWKYYDSPHWLWAGDMSSEALPVFRAGGSTWRASRLAWQLTRGRVRSGTSVSPSCGKRRCVAPSHAVWRSSDGF
jgi:hypothetical protein